MPFQQPPQRFAWLTLEIIGPGEPDREHYYKYISGPLLDHPWDDAAVQWAFKELISHHGIDKMEATEKLKEIWFEPGEGKAGVLISSGGVNFRLKVYQEQRTSGTFIPERIGFIVLEQGEPEQGKYCVQAWIPDTCYLPDPQIVFKSESIVKSVELWWGDGKDRDEYVPRSQLRFPRALTDTTPLVTICESLGEAMEVAETMLNAGPQGGRCPWEYSSSEKTCVRGTARQAEDSLIAMVVTIQYRWIGKMIREHRDMPPEELAANHIPIIN